MKEKTKQKKNIEVPRKRNQDKQVFFCFSSFFRKVEKKRQPNRLHKKPEERIKILTGKKKNNEAERQKRTKRANKEKKGEKRQQERITKEKRRTKR